jgi:hypothetical protein
MNPIYNYTSEIFYIAYVPVTKGLLFDSSHATN